MKKCRVHKCQACCCYNVPFAQGELVRFADRIVTPVISVDHVFGAELPLTVEVKKQSDILRNKCPFLRADYKCNIYDNRPDVCRKFGEIDDLPCKWLKT